VIGPGVPRIVTLAIALLVGARVATVWSDLPLQVASHFGAGGEPNGWTSREQFFGTIAVLGGGVSALLLLLPLVLALVPPELVNLPHREYFLAEERRAATMARLGGFMAWLGVATTALIALVLELSIEANLRRGPLDNGVFLLGMGLYLLAMAATVTALFRSFRLPPGAA
jgi:uncharacterized membrane protein